MCGEGRKDRRWRVKGEVNKEGLIRYRADPDLEATAAAVVESVLSG